MYMKCINANSEDTLFYSDMAKETLIYGFISTKHFLFDSSRKNNRKGHLASSTPYKRMGLQKNNIYVMLTETHGFYGWDLAMNHAETSSRMIMHSTSILSSDSLAD